MQKRNENTIVSGSQVQMENDDLNSKKVSIEVNDFSENFSENEVKTEKMFNLLNYIYNSHI